MASIARSPASRQIYRLLRDVAPVPDKGVHQVSSDAHQPVEDRNVDQTPNPVTGIHPTGPATPYDRASTCGNSLTANG